MPHVEKYETRGASGWSPSAEVDAAWRSWPIATVHFALDAANWRSLASSKSIKARTFRNSRCSPSRGVALIILSTASGGPGGQMTAKSFRCVRSCHMR
jgi:hypothetical protein